MGWQSRGSDPAGVNALKRPVAQYVSPQHPHPGMVRAGLLLSVMMGDGRGGDPGLESLFPRGPIGVLRPSVNQQVGTQGRGDAYPAMGRPHDHLSGPETASRGAHLRLVSCSAPFRSESWSACFLRIWVRASRTSTSLAHKRHLCLEPGARPPPPSGQEQAGQPSGWGPGQASAPFPGSRAPGL